MTSRWQRQCLTCGTVPPNPEDTMAKQRKIVDARSDEKGRTTHVRFGDNQRFTPVEKAKPIVERGEVSNAHIVKPKGQDSFIRTNPDRSQGNNIDEMSGDK